MQRKVKPSNGLSKLAEGPATSQTARARTFFSRTGKRLTRIAHPLPTATADKAPLTRLFSTFDLNAGNTGLLFDPPRCHPKDFDAVSS